MTASHPLRGRFVHLRPVSELDIDLVYELATDPVVSHRWLFRGEMPATREQAFTTTLRGSLVSFVIVSNRTDQVAGIVKTHSHDFRNQRVAIAMAHRAALRGAGWPLEGTALMLDWLFLNWPFRKVTALTYDFAADDTRRGVGRFFQREAHVPDLAYWNGRRWGLSMYAVYRDEWEKVAQRWKRDLNPGDTA